MISQKIFLILKKYNFIKINFKQSMTTNTSKWEINLTKGKAASLPDPIGLVRNFTDVFSSCGICLKIGIGNLR